MAKPKFIPHYIIGIDEAGRGPLAGPLAVGAVIANADFKKTFKKTLQEIKGKDSKKLTHTEREFWFKRMQVWQQEGRINFHVALISSKIIDSKGLAFSIKTAVQECLTELDANSRCDGCLVLLDGSLKAPEVFKNQRTIIKGDEKEQIISLASIAAKVTRDRLMVKLSKRGEYSLYNFDIHKGYGTKSHRALIKKHGLSSLHRATFCTNILAKKHTCFLI